MLEGTMRGTTQGSKKIVLREKELTIDAWFQTTAMIDVIFILLIFFIAVSQIKSSSLLINLPRVTPHAKQAANGAVREKNLLLIEVTGSNRIYVDGRQVDPGPPLFQRLALAKARKGDRLRVKLRGDKDAKNGVVMEVVNALARTGLVKVEFLVSKRIEKP